MPNTLPARPILLIFGFVLMLWPFLLGFNRLTVLIAGTSLIGFSLIVWATKKKPDASTSNPPPRS